MSIESMISSCYCCHSFDCIPSGLCAECGCLCLIDVSAQLKIVYLIHHLNDPKKTICSSFCTHVHRIAQPPRNAIQISDKCRHYLQRNQIKIEIVSIYGEQCENYLRTENHNNIAKLNERISAVAMTCHFI